MDEKHLEIWKAFAAYALQALIVHRGVSEQSVNLCRFAASLADTMLEEHAAREQQAQGD